MSDLCIPSAQQSVTHKEEKEVRLPQKMSGTKPGTFIYLCASQPRLHITVSWGALKTIGALTPRQTN